MNESTPSFESARERLLSIVESLEQQNESLQKEMQADEAEAVKAQNELAIANRRGERGPDWQVLQSRIDLNQTSMNAILSGEDISAEARRVRELLQKNVRRLNEEIHLEMKDDSEEEEPRVEAEQMLEDLHARIQEMKQRFGAL